MRLLTPIFAVLLGLIPWSISAQDIVLAPISVVDVERGEVLSDMAVVVSGGRISAVSPVSQVEAPESATLIDGDGRYLIPGLWDMHVHSSSEEITRDILFPLYIANGVTGVRNMAGDCREPCGPLQTSAAATLQRRRDVERGALVGPRVIAAGAITYGAEPGEASSVVAPRSAEDGRALARLHAERGLDLIKVYDQIPTEALFGLIEEGKRLGLPVVGHIPWEIGAVASARAGMRSLEHLYGVIDDCSASVEEQRPALLAAFEAGDDDVIERNLIQSLENFSVARCEVVYAELAKHEVWQVPTLVVDMIGPDEWPDHPGIDYLPRQELEYWMTGLAGMAMAIPGGLPTQALVKHRVRLISRDMYLAGVPMLAGSDALTPGVFPGFGLHDELEHMVRAGFTPAEALQAATVEPARFLASTDSLGRITPGAVADMVLLDGNPLEDIGNTRTISAVLARGKFFGRAQLDALLEGARRAAR